MCRRREKKEKEKKREKNLSLGSFSARTLTTLLVSFSSSFCCPFHVPFALVLCYSFFPSFSQCVQPILSLFSQLLTFFSTLGSSKESFCVSVSCGHGRSPLLLLLLFLLLLLLLKLSLSLPVNEPSRPKPFRGLFSLHNWI